MIRRRTFQAPVCGSVADSLTGPRDSHPHVRSGLDLSPRGFHLSAHARPAPSIGHLLINPTPCPGGGGTRIPLLCLRVVAPVLADPDLLGGGEETDDPVAHDEGVARAGLQPALPHQRAHPDDAGPEDGAQGQARREEHDAPHPEQDLEDEQEEDEHAGEDDDRGRAVQRLGGAVQEREDHGQQDGVELREEGGGLPPEDLEGRGRREDVLVKEVEGRLGEET